jgi:hypothetical protein
MPEPVFKLTPGSIKVVFMDGTSCDFVKPQGFDLMAYVHGIRSIGFLATSSFYAPAHMIKLIFDMDTATPIQANPLPNAPTTEMAQ